MKRNDFMATVNRPRDVGLRDPGVGGWGHVFSRASVLSGVAAAGLAVSLLTQSVGEVVISGTWRRRARRSDRNGYQHIGWAFIRATFFNDNILCKPPQGPGHSDESKFWNCQCFLWKCQCYSELCDWGHGALLPLCKTLHLQNAHFWNFGIFSFLHIIITQMLIIGL